MNHVLQPQISHNLSELTLLPNLTYPNTPVSHYLHQLADLPQASRFRDEVHESIRLFSLFCKIGYKNSTIRSMYLHAEICVYE